jgi:parvulin-like peptidyl-prolyl isomerase
MKNQKVNEKPKAMKRSFYITIILVLVIGISTVLAVWFTNRDKPVEESGIDDDTTVPSEQPSIMPNEISPDEILFTINGKAISMSVFSYYLYDSFSRLENRYSTNELNFDIIMGEEMTLGQYVIKNSIDGVKFSMAAEKIAEELNIDRAKTEAEVDEYLAATIKDAFGESEDAFREQLSLMGTTLESFRDIMISQRLGSQVFEQYYGEAWALSVDPSEYYDQFATASDILLFTVANEIDGLTGERVQTPLSDDEVSQKRALAETILERLNAGEDFYTLLNEYGEDPSVMLENNPEQQHTFQRSDRIYDFYVAAFATQPGQYSDIVETSHGYYIIYRLPLDTDAVAEAVKTQAFRSNLFNIILDEYSKDYKVELSAVYESSSLENWYREYKGKNIQALNYN